jgi:predicted methyltransferase
MRRTVVSLAAFGVAAALSGLIATGALAALHAPAAAPIPAYVSRAIADKDRLPEDFDRDPRRHAAELMAFAEVEPGDKVADLIPGDGYFTRIFSKIVGPRGHVYAIWPKPYADVSATDLGATQAMAKLPKWRNVSVLIQPAAAFSAPEKLDLVWTAQNYHDYPDKYMGPTDPMLLDRAVFRALKPGGVFLIVDHRAAKGAGMSQTETLHRIDPETVKAQVKAAGFVFEGESRTLANPRDTLKIKVFDEAIRGHTDQFVLRFRKPAAKP